MEESTQYTETHQKPNPGKSKSSLLIVFSALAVAIIVILIFLLTGKSHYEKGEEYLNKGQYNEALAEFQKVEEGDKDYNAAQSKINYINGLLAFNQGVKKEAIKYLAKVEPHDVYYQQAQVMLEKVNSTIKSDELEALKETVGSSKDSLLAKEQSTEKNEKPADVQIVKKYVSSLESLINKFESLYMSGRTAGLNEKKDYLHDMNTVYEEFTKLQYNSPEKNAMVLELKRLAGVWMEKRMNFIDKLIVDGSVTETSNSRSLLEEGDRAYNTMMSQMSKVKSYYSI